MKMPKLVLIEVRGGEANIAAGSAFVEVRDFDHNDAVSSFDHGPEPFSPVECAHAAVKQEALERLIIEAGYALVALDAESHPETFRGLREALEHFLPRSGL